uniref:cytochrome c oxidase subunit III n=1 Tax=Sacculina confragosa TaxID=238040 RepID=UPI002551F6CB|nr:cytochrome c oxidase subunit III [Sacculina confragosa]WGU20861.1 cytochrome c oxidase subunit III [Sacculina confragosa]
MQKHSKHLFHLVDWSFWPVVSSMNMFSFFSSLVFFVVDKSFSWLIISFFILSLGMFFWWGDVHREGFAQGCHNLRIINMIQSGMVLFILSEFFFFFFFFWSNLHIMFTSDGDFSFTWPPHGVKFFSYTSVPLLNTLILLTSGVTITYSHHLMLNNNYFSYIFWLFITIILGFYFTLLQGFEYYESYFTMSDSVFGSNFFLSTGFHGIHVIVGSLFLFVSLIRSLNFYTSFHNLNFELSIWYWHFVDVIWLFLYLVVYIWNN